MTKLHHYLANPTPELADQAVNILDEYQDAVGKNWDNLSLKEQTREYLDIHKRQLEEVRRLTSPPYVSRELRRRAMVGLRRHSSPILTAVRNLQNRNRNR